jgi:hypothetical protein
MNDKDQKLEWEAPKLIVNEINLTYAGSSSAGFGEAVHRPSSIIDSAES